VTIFGSTQTTKPLGQKPLVVNGVVVGPFKEEEEGTRISIASDVVKVNREDLATPCSKELRHCAPFGLPLHHFKHENKDF